jgi:beta-N-acetylhexosaminidase
MDEHELGNLFMIGFDGKQFNAELRNLLDELNPAGIVLFSRNIEDPFQVAELTTALQEHAKKSQPDGLFIGVDQEGGRVARFRHPFKEFPPMLELASSDDPEGQVAAFAETTARELRMVGVNLDFAPVMDVLSYTEDLQSTVIGDRAFGTESRIVSRLGRIIIESFRASGLIPCCKHFPGHGGTLVDSHHKLPVDSRDRNQLDLDLLPFINAIDINVEMIMTAHVLFDAMDRSVPATISPNVITSLLREHLSYNGVVITDDLDMGAIVNQYSPEDASVLALKAGVDLLLFCNNPSKAFSARSAIVRVLNDGDLSTECIKQSINRTQSLKKFYPQLTQLANRDQINNYFFA